MSSRRRTNAGGGGGDYTRLDTNESWARDRSETDGFTDEQFHLDVPARKFPWKTVIFIIGFMIAGAICLVAAILISTGYTDKQYADRSFPLLILGILMFIPGGYYGYILLCIGLKRDGFTMDDIPAL